MYGYNAEQPIAIPIYTVLPYCVITMEPSTRVKYCIEIGLPPGEYNEPCNINAGHKVESVSGDISGNNATLSTPALSLSGMCVIAG